MSYRKKKSKCDFILTEPPSENQIKEIEQKVNEIIKQNLPVTHKFIDYDEAVEKFKVRVEKQENEKIRITSVGDFDHCPCIGQHVENTSEICVFTELTCNF